MRRRTEKKSKVRAAEGRGSVARYAYESLAPSTHAAYASDLRQFQRWGGSVPASAEIVARYLAAKAGKLKLSTLSRRLASIAHAHTSRGLKSPVRTHLVRSTLRGIRRLHGSATRQARPLTPELLRRLCRSLKEFGSLRNVRDRALLLVGYAGAFRRSELAALELGDITFTREGVVIRLRGSKTDPSRKGRDVALPHGKRSLCPVRALRQWMAVAETVEGSSLFRRIGRYGEIRSQGLGSAAIGSVLRQRLCAVGVDPQGFSAHSLRAGFVTAAARAGVPDWAIQRQTGHRSPQMVKTYIRGLGPFERNAANVIWGQT